MAPETIDIFVHSPGRGTAICAIPADKPLTEALELAGLRVDADGSPMVFLGEHVWSEEHDDVTEAEGADTSKTARELGLRRHGHLHCHACRRVQVTVRYNGEKARSFPPQTTVNSVLAWAKHVFKIDRAAGADLLLRKCDKGAWLSDPDEHIGIYADPGSCALCLDLAKEINPQG